MLLAWFDNAKLSVIYTVQYSTVQKVQFPGQAGLPS